MCTCVILMLSDAIELDANIANFVYYGKTPMKI